MIVKKPTIIIYTCAADAQLLREVCAGIEEEGVLYEIAAHHGENAHTLSAEACEASMLGVGVGMYGSAISLHIKGMNVRQGADETTALLFASQPDAAAARDMGTNSARVIKRLPLRLSDTDAGAQR